MLLNIKFKYDNKNIDLQKFRNDILYFLKSNNLYGEVEIIPKRNLEVYQNIVEGMNFFSSRIQTILNFISNDYCRPITLRQAANMINLSVFHFEKVFLSEIGVPFKRYLNVFRLYKAAESLRMNHTTSITDICFDVGFNDLSNFITQFKRIFGCSPKKYMNCHINPSQCVLRKNSLFYMTHINNKLNEALIFPLKLACYIKNPKNNNLSQDF